MVFAPDRGPSTHNQPQPKKQDNHTDAPGTLSAPRAGVDLRAAAQAEHRSLEQQTKSPAQQQKLDPRVQQAIDRIIRFDPSLKPIIEKLRRDGRLQFMVAPDGEFQAAAREVMGPDFRGDAFTGSAVVVGPDGKVKSTRHVVVLSESALRNGGQAFVALAHELYHCKRAVEGKAAPQDYRREERETFTASIKAAEASIRKIEEAARNSKDASARERLAKLAREMREALVADRKALQSYK